MSSLELTNLPYSEISIKVPWGHISGRWYGDQMIKPILALHGWLDSCGSFARLAPLIAPYRSILCIDLPGHGHSTHLPIGILYHSMEFVRVILRIMQAYNWKTVSLMGHSMGGTVCFYFAAIYPERVDMVISLDIIKSYYWEPPLYLDILQQTIEKALIDNERLLSKCPPQPPNYTLAECEELIHSMESVEIKNCKYILEPNIMKSELFPEKYYFSRDGRMKYYSDLNTNWGLTHEMAKRICNKCMPYLVIKGGLSKNISAMPTELDELMVKENRHFECHIYPKGTHHLHLNNPEPVAQVIIKFLQKYDESNKIAQLERSKL
ncbi:putative serine hydrolase [Cochliomyia hominivorax]